MQKIKKGDDVMVLTGRDKGKRGTILRRIDEDHVLVEGVNKVKKQQKPNPGKNQTGGIIEKEMPCIFQMSPYSILRLKRLIVWG